MILWSMKFQVIQPMMTFPRPVCIEKESHSDPIYYRHGPSEQSETYSFLQYTVSGRGTFNDNIGSHSITPGKMFLGNVTNRNYEYFYPADATEPWVFLWFGFGGGYAHAAVAEMVQRNGAVYDLPIDKGAIKTLIDYKNYSGLTYELTPYDGMKLVTNVLASIAKSCWSQHPQDPRSVLVRKVQQIITDNLDKPIKIEHLADQLTISREHLSRVFKDHIGMTLQDYILRQKMSLACKLIKETNLSTKEVSARLGYDRPSQFTRSFKKLLNVPPTQFRQMNTNVVL